MDATDLHALSRASLGGDGTTMEPACTLALAANFGSVARWRDDFVAMGQALGGASGWLLLSFQPREGTLVNQWATGDGHAVGGGVPLLALRMDEHAHRVDRGAAAGAHAAALVASIDWAAAYARYRQAVQAATETIGIAAEGADGALLLDVRRAGVFAQAPTLLPGAAWFDPAHVAQWAAELPKDRPLVVYCVYGHEVSGSTALRLRAAGLDARYLRGGIEGWQAAGRPVVAKAAG